MAWGGFSRCCSQTLKRGKGEGVMDDHSSAHSFINPSTQRSDVHPSTRLSIQPSIHPAVHPSNHPTVHPSTRPSIHPKRTSHISAVWHIWPCGGWSICPQGQWWSPRWGRLSSWNRSPRLLFWWWSRVERRHPIQSTWGQGYNCIHKLFNPENIHPSIHPSTHPSIHPSVHLPIRPSTHPSIYPSVHPPIRPSTHSSIYPSVHPPTLQPILPSTISTTKSPSEDRIELVVDFILLVDHFVLATPYNQVGVSPSVKVEGVKVSGLEKWKNGWIGLIDWLVNWLILLTFRMYINTFTSTFLWVGRYLPSLNFDLSSSVVGMDETLSPKADAGITWVSSSSSNL